MSGATGRKRGLTKPKATLPETRKCVTHHQVLVNVLALFRMVHKRSALVAKSQKCFKRAFQIPRHVSASYRAIAQCLSGQKVWRKNRTTSCGRSTRRYRSKKRRNGRASAGDSTACSGCNNCKRERRAFPGWSWVKTSCGTGEPKTCLVSPNTNQTTV